MNDLAIYIIFGSVILLSLIFLILKISMTIQLKRLRRNYNELNDKSRSGKPEPGRDDQLSYERESVVARNEQPQRRELLQNPIINPVPAVEPVISRAEPEFKQNQPDPVKLSKLSRFFPKRKPEEDLGSL
jgi:hypothetical protein